VLQFALRQPNYVHLMELRLKLYAFNCDAHIHYVAGKIQPRMIFWYETNWNVLPSSIRLAFNCITRWIVPRR
jgi:hypothetical protein